MAFLKLGENRRLKDLEISVNLKNLGIGDEGISDLKRLGPRTGGCYVLSHLSHVQPFVTLWTVAQQAPRSKGFSRQGYWSGLPCPPPENLPDPGIQPKSLMFPSLAGGFFTSSANWEAQDWHQSYHWKCQIHYGLLYILGIAMGRKYQLLQWTVEAEYIISRGHRTVAEERSYLKFVDWGACLLEHSQGIL